MGKISKVLQNKKKAKFHEGGHIPTKSPGVKGRAGKITWSPHNPSEESHKKAIQKARDAAIDKRVADAVKKASSSGKTLNADMSGEFTPDPRTTFKDERPTLQGQNITDTIDAVEGVQKAADVETPQESIIQMDAGTDVEAPTIDAPTMAETSTGTTKTAKTPVGFKAAQQDVELAGDLGPTGFAAGNVSQVAEAEGPQLTERAEAAERDISDEQKALAEDSNFRVSSGSYVNKVTGKVTDVAPTPEAEIQQREAILGEAATEGEAAEILSMYSYNEAQKRAIRGSKAKEKAIKQLKRQGLKDDEIAKQLADNPELIADQMEELPEEVKTTLSGLPQEALVSVQMESLLSGMEDGEVPAWARPAVDLVQNNLAQRGLSVSTVGRDALFNAIIQSAIPIAQSNAQAIQTATSQDKQIASTFLSKNAEFRQQMELANLSNEQQMRLANLTALNNAESENLSARQQTELANLNAKLQTNLKSAEIANSMGLAQLNVDQQRAVQNATTVANIDLTRFNAEQQVELANSKFMQTATLADFNARQQASLQNATAMASMDLATADQATKLAITNAQNFLKMDLQNLNNAQQSMIFDQQAEQQRLLSDQAATNASRQFNATSQNQVNQFMTNLSAAVDQFNVTQANAMQQFNNSEKNKREALEAGNKLEAAKIEAQIEADINKYNEQIDLQRDQWNAANAQAVEQSNIQYRRQTNTAFTAAQNAANQQNVQNAYNLTALDQAQLWQQLRDEASYIRTAYENEENRKAQLYATAIGNEAGAAKKDRTTLDSLIGTIDEAFSGGKK
jgi:hypothetical protein